MTNEWQTIETAPQDGRLILAVGDNYGQKGRGNHYAVVFYDGYGFYESFDESAGEEKGDELEYLTHWTPLPRPPK